jgi:protein phosphatase
MAAQIHYVGETDVGLKRQNNEDALAVRPDLGLCVVADGMGGAAAGEVASRIFVETVVEVFADGQKTGQDDCAGQIQYAFGLANERILRDVDMHPQRKGMGCTAEVVVFSDGGYVLGHLGDSRTYRYRNDQLKQLSSDHSLIQEQIDQGILSPEEAKTHPMRNVILRAVGVKEEVALDILKGRTYPGDQYLLCSDGLTDMVDDGVIEGVLASELTLEERANKLVGLAKSAGGKDNITIVLAEVI